MKRAAAIAAVGVVCLCIPSLVAQRRVDLANQQERIIAVVPMIGTGTVADPRRPLFAPIGREQKEAGEGITGFSYQLTDDGKSAIVEFVARDRAAFESIVKDARVLKSFVKGEARKEDIDSEMKKHKKDFSIAKSRELLPGLVAPVVGGVN